MPRSCLIARFLRLSLQGLSHETYLSAVSRSPQADTWLPCPHVHSRWTWRDQRPARQGSPSPRGLSRWPEAASEGQPRPAAFPKTCRLLRTDEYSSVFAFRKALKSRHFLLHYRPQQAVEAAGARLGLVVAKRFLRRSVDRNLLRRLAREEFRLLRVDLVSHDLVLRLAVKPSALDRKAMAQEIRRLLCKLASPQP